MPRDISKYVQMQAKHRQRGLRAFANHFVGVELSEDLNSGRFYTEVRGVMTKVKVNFHHAKYMYYFYTPGTKELLGLVGCIKKQKCLAKADLSELSAHIIWRQQKSYLPGG